METSDKPVTSAKSLKSPKSMELDGVRYDASTGLIPVIVQDAQSRDVLMVAYANREALKRTFGTGYAWFWSRSRQEYWQKGATSGNTMRVVDLRVDCDGDAVLYLVKPEGPACHTGEWTCFYRTLAFKHGELRAESPESAGTEWNNAAIVTSNDGIADATALDDLWAVIADRWERRPAGSYTTYLFEQGVDKVAKKVGEEATEVVIAAKNALQTGAGKHELMEESADLLYHLLALWKVAGVEPEDINAVLASRGR